LQSLSRRRTKFKEEREQEMPQQAKEELERDRGMQEGDCGMKAKRRAESERYIQRATSKRWNTLAGRESQREQIR